MKRVSYAVLLLGAILGAFAPVYGDSGVTVSNKVVMVDELGVCNATNVLADVARQATNEVRVIIASEKATAAQAAADEASAVVTIVVASITANEVRIFRKGYMSSFAPLIVITADDKILICEFTLDEDSGLITIGYVSTADFGTTKPQVRSTDTLTSPTADWELLPDADVSAVTEHAEAKTVGGVTYSSWYSITVPYTNDKQHFYAIEVNPDAPSGSGYTLDIKNGITGGYTGEITDGSLMKVYKGGVLMSVTEND